MISSATEASQKDMSAEITRMIDIKAFIDERPIAFSAREIAVLEHLLRRSGRVVAKSLLESSLYGPAQEVGSNAVEVHVHRLRRHLVETGATVQVHTVRGVGYMIGEEK